MDEHAVRRVDLGRYLYLMSPGLACIPDQIDQNLRDLTLICI